jgi:hypothetical protein
MKGRQQACHNYRWVHIPNGRGPECSLVDTKALEGKGQFMLAQVQDMKEDDDISLGMPLSN